MLFVYAPQTDSSFQAFWAVYPVHKAKGDAEKAWRQVKGTTHLAAILAAIEAQKAERRTPGWHPHWAYPASWLRARRWEDEPDPSPVSAPSLTPREIEHAAEIRRKAYGRCPHEPACPTYGACLQQIALTRRASADPA